MHVVERFSSVRSKIVRPCLAGALILTSLTGAPATAQQSIELAKIGTFTTGAFDVGASEIVAYDPSTQRLFVINAQAARVDVLDVSDPTAPTLHSSIDVTPYGAVANSVDVHDGVVAVAVQNAVKTDRGMAVFFDTDGNFLSAVKAGALPDMITFTPGGKRVLVANEGEPDDDYVIDPEGSVTIIDISGGADKVTQKSVRTADFRQFNNRELDPSIRIFGPNASVAQDLEPEYIAVSSDSKLAWVTLQENNAIGILDIEKAEFTTLVGLGFKDHNFPGNGLDASDRDNAINIARWPVKGMYLPDGIATYRSSGTSFLVTANEGDVREYDGFAEASRIGSLNLDPAAFPDAADLKQNAKLGRLNVTKTLGDTGGDSDFDELYSFGARSFSLWTADGHLIYDSGKDLEQITATAFPANFNCSHTNNTFDNRSDDKGPEPEGVVLGKVGSRTYAFIGLERISGIMVYDITNPFRPRFVQYFNDRDFAGDPAAGTAGDLGPEGLIFIEAKDSPTGKPLLVVGNEVSGTTTIYAISKILNSESAEELSIDEQEAKAGGVGDSRDSQPDFTASKLSQSFQSHHDHSLRPAGSGACHDQNIQLDGPGSNHFGGWPSGSRDTRRCFSTDDFVERHLFLSDGCRWRRAAGTAAHVAEIG